MNDLFEKTNSSMIKVIGVGGGGGNAVAYMYEQGIHGVDFAVSNTDKQALEISPVINKVQLGPNHTEGLGAGSIPEVGKQACIESIDDVRKFLENDTKMLFITAGMGGGTGTGAAPIIAKAAKEMDILTVAIVTLPFKFEGLRRKNQAMLGLEELKKNVDSLLVISNDRVKELYGDLTITKAFGKADDILATAARGIAEIITVAGYINVDFKDVNTVMKNSGVSIMGYAEAEGEDRARQAVYNAINSPLLEDNDIRGAQHILLNITSGSKEVTMDEIAEITEYIEEEAGTGTDLIWGNCKDTSLGESISVTLIATGFDKRIRRVEPLKRVGINDDEVTTMSNRVKASRPFDINEDDGNATVVEFEDVKVTRRDSTEPFVKCNTSSAPEEEAQPQTLKERRRVIRTFRRELEPTRPIDNPRDIGELEDVPAYKRRKVSLDDEVARTDERESRSKLSINLDENDSPRFERNNSFFHDNVD